MFKKILRFVIRLLPFVSRLASKDLKPLQDALDEVDRLEPLKKERSWRNKLPH